MGTSLKVMKGVAQGGDTSSSREARALPSPAQSSICTEFARPGSSRTSESACSFHKDPWEQSVQRCNQKIHLASNEAGWTPAPEQGVTGGALYVSRDLGSELPLWKLEKDPNLDLRKHCFRISKSWVRKSLVSTPWEKSWFCVIEKSDC